MEAQAIEDMFSVAVAASAEGRLEDAIAAFQAVLVMSPGHDEALFGLGLALMQTRRFSEAVEPLARAAAAPDAEPIRHQCLAQAQFLTGDFAGAAATFAAVDVVEPVPEGARLTWARAAAYAVLDGSSAQEALDLYARIAGPGAEAPETVARESFGILVAFQRLDAARALGAWLEAHDPADTVRAHELRVLVEPGIDKAPAAYVEALFDGFAERFDHQLVDMLGYEAPALLAELVASHRQQFDRILDLGCGTGLAGPHLKRFGGRLIGVDLSSGMLAKAAERGGYYALVQDEAVAFLESHPGAFDLIVSADVLIYFGELGPLFSAAAAALPTGGLLAVSTELGQDGWTLLPSARYAHGDAYVRASASGFRILERQEIPLRREGADVTVGCLYLLERI
uniref:methyltransferase domain-containing protein n=1 Tax=uncultured Caulobacter sp. TaxID=158749 RepID=UPI0025D6126B|nr:methyltransferase domain-containing protein [uncultured Caulobacter sp.]